MTCAAFLLSGCVAAATFAGANLHSDGAPADIRDLANRAAGGDKRAQLDLGIHYEEGRGVDTDIRRATSLYRAAASDSGGVVFLWSSGINGSPGRTIPVYSGPRIAGLAEAKIRLRSLERRTRSADGAK